MPWLVGILFHTVSPVWSHQKCLWPQNGLIWALLAHLEGLWHLRWPLLIREMVPMHRPGHALTCCNLVPHSFTSLEQPDPLNSHTWTFWSFWTHLVHQIAPSAFKMKKGGGHIFQLSLICTLKAIEVIKKVKKRKKDWVTELWQINTLCSRSCPVVIGACDGVMYNESGLHQGVTNHGGPYVWCITH